MVVNFSNLDFSERPILILKNAGETPLGVLGYAEGVSLDLCYNETSTIEFNLPAFVDGAEVPFYKDTVGMRIVELRNIGQFKLVNPQETGDGVTRRKLCKGYSLEYEFVFKKISLPKDTYNFWNPSSPEDTLLGMIMERMPAWSIGTVSSTLVNRYRTYEVNNENLYNFIKGTVQESYNCIFEFDTLYRVVNVVDVSKEAVATPVFISTENLAKEIVVTENTEDVVTRLDVNGAEGVDIRAVNPNGTNKIINLDYYMDTSNFSQELIDRYYEWKNLNENYRQDYYLLSIEYSVETMRKVTEEARLTELKNELISLENAQAVTIQAIAQNLQEQSDLTAINESIAAQKALIASKEEEITGIQDTIDGVMLQLESIKNTCSFESFFDESELLALDRYIKDDEISESSFVVSETESYNTEPTGRSLTSMSCAFMDASITDISDTSGRNIYDITGGKIILSDILSAKVVSAVMDVRSDSSFVITAQLGSGFIDSNSFTNASLSITGSTSHVYDVSAESPEGSGVYIKNGLVFTITSGYFYFTFDSSEYQKYNVAWDLFEYGEEVLAKLAQPSYTFSVTSANFFSMKDFVAFRDHIDMGKKLYVPISEDTILSPICIGVHIAFDDPSSLDLRFSDSYVSSDSTFRLVDLLNKSVSMGKNVELSKYIYSSFVDSGASTGVKEFMTSALDVAKNAIISSGNQAVSWDASGIRLRRWANEAKTAYEDEQIWMINNSIVMTDDNWETAKMAIGKFYDENLGECWGIVAERVVGTLIAGSELIIESAKKDGGVSVFRVDGNGVRLYNGDLSISNGYSQILLNPEVGFVIGVPSVLTDAGAINESNAKFWVDTDGNVHLKGTLHGANGDFTGALTATSLTIKSGDTSVDIDTYVGEHDSVTGAQQTATNAATAASNAQSTANAASTAAANAQTTANAANTNASNALNTANSASSTASAAQTLANNIYNGVKGIYFTNSSVGSVQISSTVGLKVIGTDNTYFQVKNNAMGFFRADNTAMLYYEDGNMVLSGVIAAAGSYIGGTDGWVIGTDCIYNGGASALGAEGGIYLGKDGISISSAIVMKPDGTFIIRNDNASSSDSNYVLRVSPETNADGDIIYTMYLSNVTFDEGFVLPVKHGGTGGTTKSAIEAFGIYRVTSEDDLSSLTEASNGDIGILYSDGEDGSTIVGTYTTAPTSTPGYLSIATYSNTGHRYTSYFGISTSTVAYWNTDGLSGDQSVSNSYARVGVGSTTSGSCGLFVPLNVVVENSTLPITTFKINFTFNMRPSGCTRDLIASWTRGIIVAVYRPGSNGSYTLIARAAYNYPSSWQTTSNTDRAASITLTSNIGLTTGEYYVVFYNGGTRSLTWIKAATVCIPSTSTGAAAGLYLRTGGMWRALASVS